jgi:peptide/nickel transport system ATP-binding protein
MTEQITSVPSSTEFLDDDEVLRLQNLNVSFRTDDGLLQAVNEANISLKRSQKLGIIGESGCGKSVTSQAILRIIPRNGKIDSGQILYRKKNGETIDLAQLDPRGEEIRRIRGGEIAIVFQEPMTSLSPVHTIGNQMIEAIMLHVTQDKKEAYNIALDMLTRVGIANPAQRLGEYPHQLSGGMRQRALIALALSCRPNVLIADEPTTALDVTMQAQILELIQELQEEFKMSIIYITHDLGVIAEVCDYVAVMYLGRVIEYTTVENLFRNPLHPYTRALMRSIPTIGRRVNLLEAIEGIVPRPINLPEACGFYTRCPVMISGLCNKVVPQMVEEEPGHFVECFHYGQQPQ